MTPDQIKMVNGLRLIREKLSWWQANFVMGLFRKSEHFSHDKLSAKQTEILERLHRLNHDLVAEAVEKHQQHTEAWVNKALTDSAKARKDYYNE